MIDADLHLSPLAATILFVIAVFAGYRYRANWKQEGPAWKAWMFGSIACVCFLTVGLVPVR
ncbi:MAG: hypothetical protein AAFY34_05355 [Pseudomonadota bacterium]